MPVVIEAFTVLVRNSTLAEKYPGGVDGFAAACPNRTYCTDGVLSRIAFMRLDAARAFVAKLSQHGLEGVSDDGCVGPSLNLCVALK